MNAFYHDQETLFSWNKTKQTSISSITEIHNYYITLVSPRKLFTLLLSMKKGCWYVYLFFW